jgi:hypothetical protein
MSDELNIVEKVVEEVLIDLMAERVMSERRMSSLLFLWLGVVFRRLFVRSVFVILWLLRICKPELPFVLVLKFMLNFNSISISSTE